MSGLPPAAPAALLPQGGHRQRTGEANPAAAARRDRVALGFSTDPGPCGLMSVHGHTVMEQAVDAAFAAGGPLARADAGYVEREVQQVFARAVARAIEARSALVVEAGTGVGKTFAYLVPLLLSGRRALVSTATKSLQDQLFGRDLPRLAQALRVPARLALLKGRASYLCLHRLDQARQGAQLPDRLAVRALARVEQWAPSTRTGDLAELAGLDERSPVIPLVTSTRDNCLGGDCPRWRDCHVMAARREAMAADIVVVNHHLFFADLALRDSGVAELLPTVDAAIFDEAHQLVEAGVQFLGRQLGSAAVIDFARDLLAAGLQHARGLQPWSELATACDRAARELRLAAGAGLRDVRGTLKRRWSEVAGGDGFGGALAALAGTADDAAAALDTVSELAPDFPKLQQRAGDLARLAHRFAAPCDADRVRWVDLTPLHVRLVESALDIREALDAQRAAAPKAWVFTSATLGDDERLTWFTAPSGLGDASALKLGSPFDYAAHARLWVPSRLPRPGDAAHAQAVARVAAQCAGVLGGQETTSGTRQVFRKKLREGELDEKEIEIDVATSVASMRRAVARVSPAAAATSDSVWRPGARPNASTIEKPRAIARTNPSLSLLTAKYPPADLSAPAEQAIVFVKRSKSSPSEHSDEDPMAQAQAFETDFWKDANLRKVWDEIVPGEPRKTLPYVLTKEAIQLYCRSVGEDHPLYFDEAYARTTPYGGLIASGWHTASLTMRMLVDHVLSRHGLGSPGLDELRWLAPVRPGDRLRCRATVLEARRSRSKPDRGIVRQRVETFNQRGETVLAWTAAGLVRCRTPAPGAG